MHLRVFSNTETFGCLDFDPAFINDAKKIVDNHGILNVKSMIYKGSFEKNFNGAFSLDVLEHFEIQRRRIFQKYN